MSNKLHHELAKATNKTFVPAHLQPKPNPFANKNENVILQKIPLDKINRDPVQPRRAVPDELFEQYPKLRHAPPDQILQVWINILGWDCKALIDDIVLKRQTDHDEEIVYPPTEARLVEIIQLAASIKRDGLTHPITVAGDGTVYIVESGERRLLAFNLLHSLYPNEGYESIPSNVKPDLDRWAQATENSARQNLNAIATTRQLAILSMDITRKQHPYQPITAFDTDRDFYAQALAISKLPNGSTELLVDTLSLQSRVMVSRYRSLLNLCPAAWNLADTHNIPEGKLRKIAKLPKAKQQVRAIQELLEPPEKPQEDKVAKNLEVIARKLDRFTAPDQKRFIAELEKIIADFKSR